MDFIIGSGIAAFIIYASAKWDRGDQYKIKHVFRNINYKVKNKEPRLIKKNRKDNHTEYVYNVPYGLINDPKLQSILEKTLSKPVVVKFKGKLIINVYESNLSTEINYDWPKTKPWTVIIGKTLNGYIHHNFDHIPHMTVAGMTRQGKTVFLKLILAHLINNNPSVEFHVIDLKGGLEFGPYECLKQIRNVSSNVDEAAGQLESITSQIKADMSAFKSKGHNNIVNTNIAKRTFIIVDEAAELNKECQEYLSEIARIGGALGYRLIFATQYPTSDTLPRQIKQNADAKITFRLPTEIASRVAIDEGGAEQLTCPGRAIYRTHEKHIVQVPYVTDKEIKEKLGGYFDANSDEDAAGRKNIVEFG